MAKKDFSVALSAGIKKDEALRTTDISSRFEKVEAALDGRNTLLESRKANPTSKNLEPTELYLQSLQADGKIRTRYAWWPIDRIGDNPLNSRTIYQSEKIAARAASMAKDGQLVPALASRHPSDPHRAILIGGRYRKQAALQNRAKTLDLKLIDGLGLLSTSIGSLARQTMNENMRPLLIWLLATSD